MRGRTVRRLGLALALVGGSAFWALNPGIVKAFYEDLYPSDPAKRQALELCFMQDHKFNRLEPEDREACYRRMLRPLGATASASEAAAPGANLVDLQRAAGAGSMPRNDIRRFEQNDNAPHSR